MAKNANFEGLLSIWSMYCNTCFHSRPASTHTNLLHSQHFFNQGILWTHKLKTSQVTTPERRKVWNQRTIVSLTLTPKNVRFFGRKWFQDRAFSSIGAIGAIGLGPPQNGGLQILHTWSFFVMKYPFLASRNILVFSTFLSLNKSLLASYLVFTRS